MRHKYEQDKYQIAMEARFKSLIGSREQEWEKAWEKKDDILTIKDRLIHDVAYEQQTLKDVIARNELEIESFQMQVNRMVTDHAHLAEDFKQRLQIADTKNEELLK